MPGTDLSRLASQLLEDPKHANNLTKIISNLNSKICEEELRELTRSVKLYFLDAFDKHGLRSSLVKEQDSEDPLEVFAAPVFAVQRALVELIADPATPAAAQVEALMALMEFVRGEEPGAFRGALFTSALEAVLRSSAFSGTFLGALSNKFLQFADVRYFVLQAVHSVASSLSDGAGDGGSDGGKAGSTSRGAGGGRGAHGHAAPPDEVARNCFDLLCAVAATMGARPRKLSAQEQILLQALGQDPPEAEQRLLSWCGGLEANVVAAVPSKKGRAGDKRKRDEEGGGGAVRRSKWASPKLQRRAFSQAWLAFLRMDLPQDIHRKVLLKLPTVVIPNLTNPLLLSDFLTRMLDQSGLIAVLALNGLFLLVTQHGLEYPNFYKRLYGLLTADVFKVKHRVQFFKLVDAFLSSSLVPAYTAASFAKRFARLALFLSPAAALIAMGFVHNLIRRHPSCLVLLHRPSAIEESANDEDVFQMSCEDPAETRAIESSLWEIATLKAHYNPDVARMATMMLEKDITDRRKTAEIDIETLTCQSYSSMVEAELKRRLKRVPIAFYPNPPRKLFDDEMQTFFPGWRM
eukprot:CAMPEP_0177578348 /NCGR_PEP_ID=MMETSP0419_2-20121207/296_1 /TAXON_ID=582737 /ORGANISM="Tetraselmis sp., Strain GSL018" /LENGTH=576 /DNA_ID=CAMNT_0019066777 /DNA_START=92 /DNA_END=1823 /DNA_ORIENTATION=-